MSKQTRATLDPVEIEQLITVYNSELRQLNYRVLSVRKNIEQLESALAKIGKSPGPKVGAAPVEVARSTPESSAAMSPDISSSSQKAASALKKVPAPTPAPVRRRRKLSPWDQFIIDTLEDKGKVMIMSEILEIVSNDFQEAQGLGEAKIKSKLNAVFHKLANKKGALVKINFEGRGFAYALPGWLNGAGELKKKHRR